MPEISGALIIEARDLNGFSFQILHIINAATRNTNQNLNVVDAIFNMDDNFIKIKMQVIKQIYQIR
jgi:hypothetical protein